MMAYNYIFNNQLDGDMRYTLSPLVGVTLRNPALVAFIVATSSLYKKNYQDQN
jgi:hypothetical protein